MTPAAERRVFHGWWIVLATFVCLVVNTGLVFYSWGVFLGPLVETFGSRARVAGAFSAMSLASAAYGLAVGRLVDRHGARPVAIAGAVFLAAGYVLLGRVHSLLGLYLCLAGPIALGSTCLGPLPSNAAVARWFVRQRGRALGLSTAGFSAGGIIFAPLAQHLIARHGWRTAATLLGLLVLAIVLPPVIGLLRRDPADMGLAPDGDPVPRPSPDGIAAVEREIERSIRPSEAVRQASFWYLASAFSLTVAGLSAVLLYEVPLLIDRGIDESDAAIVLSATAAVGVLGKLGFGMMLDRFDQRWVAAACFCLQSLGVLVLIGAETAPWIAAFVVLYGYGMGGNVTLFASLIGRAFGRMHYGAIAGRISPFVVVAQSAGVPAMGYLRDVTGGYEPALGVVVGTGLLAAVLVWRVRLPDLHR